jgi:hypothetical protein
MRVEDSGSSIGAKNEEPEVCYIPLAGRLAQLVEHRLDNSSQRVFRGFGELSAVAPIGSEAASLSDKSPESSRASVWRFLTALSPHVAFLLHGVARIEHQTERRSFLAVAS